MTVSNDHERRTTTSSPAHGHDLVRVTEWVPGSEPTDYEIELSDLDGYRTIFWRCRKCGQERTRQRAFREPCTVIDGQTLLSDGGYSLDDSRTWKALTEEMDIRFGDVGPIYEVDSSSGKTYEVDVEAGTCSCPDHRKRGAECKHLRRVLFEIRTRVLPQPTGRFATCEQETRRLRNSI
ncbi:hypothetical protein [Haloferax volcanii]|uniref:hypothetical protein n=1 Tax=Haloferax volcanii TaxID=2246 RepID=UPI001F1182BE|nr:hypothetical protein [Haloferax alexandrinus]